MKKFLRFVPLLALCLALLLLLMPQRANAATTSDLTFARNEDGESYSVTDCKQYASGKLVIPATYNGKPVTSIGYNAFYNCDSLTSITIPDSVTSIGSYAFSYCDRLTSVTIGNSVTSISSSAFRSCTNLTSITIPDSVTSIGGNAFSGCSRLTSVTIPDSVTSIGSSAFYYCTSLTSVTIPDSVTSIGNEAFSSCASLTGIWVDKENSAYCSDEYGVLYNKDKTTLIQAPGGIQGSYTVPDSVTSIGDDAFCNCTSLTSITIPDSVTGIGSYAFYNCTSLTSITIPDSVTSIGFSAFCNCTRLTSITIGNHIESISDRVFYNCRSLTSVAIPAGVTSIGYEAFYNCTNITSIIVPDSVTSIGHHAFFNCGKLSSLTIGVSITSIGSKAFDGCTSLPFNLYDNAKYLGSKTNPYMVLVGAISGDISTCEIQQDAKLIYPYAFYKCGDLTSVTIPSGVVSIGNHAFRECSSLRVATIPDSVTSIGDYAFYYCQSLTSVTIPADIGDYAFAYCTGLMNVTIQDNVASIGHYAFLNCTSLTSVTIPNSVASIYSAAFEYCHKLKHVVYGGTLEQWKEMNIESHNAELTSASVWHYEGTNVNVGYRKNCINAGLYCNLCGDFLTKEKEESGTHSYDNICDEVCDDCGETRTTAHSYEWVVDKQETCAENGIKHEECSVCRTIRNANTVIEATGKHSYDADAPMCSVCGYGRTIQSIAIGQHPTKRYYSLLRDELDTTGGTIIVTYSDGSTEEIAITEDMITSFYIRKYGRQSLQVNYCGKRTYFTIIVQADYTPDKLEILTKPEQVSYLTNQEVAWAGLTLKATYEDVAVELALTEVTVDAVDMTTPGMKAVTVRYYDAVVTFPIFVHEKVWFTIDSALYPESKHNYAANTNETKTFTYPGVEKLELTFSAESYTESSCDFVYILDGSGNEIGKYSGTLSGKVVTVPGDTVQIKLTSDDGVNKYGYAFSSIRGYVIDHPGEDFCEICGELKDTTSQSIVLQENMFADTMTIPAGVTIDLNGHVLTADSLASFGQIIDSVGGGGLIANNIEISGNDWLPIQDETGCYRFYRYEVENLGTKADSDSVTFGFTMDFADVAAYGDLLKTGDVQITVTLAWGENVKTFAFSRELIAEYVALVEKYPGLRPYLKLDVTGLDSLEDGTKLIVIPAITAVGGKMQNTGNEMTYTA